MASQGTVGFFKYKVFTGIRYSLQNTFNGFHGRFPGSLPGICGNDEHIT